jgi:hypothetical protein
MTPILSFVVDSLRDVAALIPSDMITLEWIPAPDAPGDDAHVVALRGVHTVDHRAVASIAPQPRPQPQFYQLPGEQREYPTPISRPVSSKNQVRLERRPRSISNDDGSSSRPASAWTDRRRVSISDDLIAFEVLPWTTPPESIILVVNDAPIDLPKIEPAPVALPITEEEARLRELEHQRKSIARPSRVPLNRADAVTQTDFPGDHSREARVSHLPRASGGLGMIPGEDAPPGPESQRHNTPEKSVPLEPEMLPTRSDGVNFPSSTELFMSEDRGDPFATAAGLLQRLGRFCRQAIGKQVGIVKELGAETSGYDAYLSATNPADQTHFDYVRKVHQHKRDLEQGSDVLQNILIATDQMRRLTRGMSSQYERAQKTIQELQAREAQQALALQQEVLNGFATSLANANQDLPPEVAQLAHIHAVSSSLGLADILGLVKDDTAQQERDRLAQRIEQMKEQLTSGEKPISQDQTAELVRDSQVFIANLQTETKIAATHVNEPPPPTSTPTKPDSPPVDRTKIDLARVRRHRDELARDLKASKSREERLKVEIQRLKEQLENERSLAEGDINKYTTQIATLREVLDTT